MFDTIGLQPGVYFLVLDAIQINHLGLQTHVKQLLITEMVI